MKSKTKLIGIATITILIGINCTKANKDKSPLEKKDSIKVTDSKLTNYAENQNEKYIYIDNFQDYHSIEELIKYKDFENNVLYIDLWSIGCVPCINEFQFLKELKERFKNKPVKFIYIADGPEKISPFLEHEQNRPSGRIR